MASSSSSSPSLHDTIDGAVPPLGGSPLVTAPALNRVLHALADTLAASSASSLALATLPELTAAQAGAQAFALPVGAHGVFDLAVREAATGAVRALYPADYAVAEEVLSVQARAGLQAGDRLSGSYTTQPLATPAATYPGGTPPVVVPPSGPPVAPAAPVPFTLPNLVRERVAQFTVAPGRSVAAYEVTFDGGSTWQPATTTRLPVPTEGLPGGRLGVRLAAEAAGVPASAATYLPTTPAAWYGLGLRVRYYLGMWGIDYSFFHDRTPFYEEVVQQAGRFWDPFFDKFTQLSGYVDYFSILFDGFLHIKQAGTYLFSSSGDDTAGTWLGEALADPTYANRAEAATSGVYLAEGMHPIRLAFGQYTGPKYMSYLCNGMDLGGLLSAGRLYLLTNTPPVPDAQRAPAGLLADADFDQELGASSWAAARGWDVVQGVLLGTNTDATAASLPAGAAGTAYPVEVSLDLAPGAQLRLEAPGLSPATTVLTTAGVHRFTLTRTDAGPAQLLLRAENNALVQVHYAQVLAPST